MTHERESIRFARDLSFPIDLITQRVAIMGTSGGGKTYGAGVLVEGMVDAGAQVVVVDGIGIWYGLRLAKDGKRKGLSIPVFGGEHGDLPLEPTAGAVFAKLVAEKRLSMVLDVSDMNGAEQRRFVTEFAVALHRGKKANRSAVMVVWEECQDFVPQKVSGDVAKMVGAMERLIKQGRNYGIGTTLISQRPQAVNKDVLNQCGVLLAFQTIGKHERKAIKDWVVHNGVEQMTQLNELPSLPVGVCFVWSPAWLKIFQRVRVLEKRTLDTSKAPEFGDVAAAYELPPVEMDELRKEMAATIEKAKADDPKLLRAKVVDLEKRLKAAESAKPEPKVERVEVPVLQDKDRGALLGLIERIEEVGIALGEAAAGIRTALSPVRPVAAEPRRPVRFGDVIVRRDPKGFNPEAPRLPRDRNGQGDVDRYQHSILEALSRFMSMGQTQVSRRHVAALAGKSPRSSAFDGNLAKMRAAGLIEYGSDGTLAITTTGMAHAPVAPTPTTPDELIGAYKAHILSDYEGRLLDALVDAGGKWLDREELAERSQTSAASSQFDGSLGSMRKLGILEYGPERTVRAAETLLTAGAR